MTTDSTEARPPSIAAEGTPRTEAAAAVAALARFRAMTAAERRTARDAAGLSRRDVAEVAACSETIVRLWETDGHTHAPSRRLAQPYALLLDSLGVLFPP